MTTPGRSRTAATGAYEASGEGRYQASERDPLRCRECGHHPDEHGVLGLGATYCLCCEAPSDDASPAPDAGRASVETLVCALLLLVGVVLPTVAVTL